MRPLGRTLTGAWIETTNLAEDVVESMRRTLTGAWIETRDNRSSSASSRGRTLTGAWIETKKLSRKENERIVAPSRVRGLKQYLRS